MSNAEIRDDTRSDAPNGDSHIAHLRVQVTLDFAFVFVPLEVLERVTAEVGSSYLSREQRT